MKLFNEITSILNGHCAKIGLLSERIILYNLRDSNNIRILIDDEHLDVTKENYEIKLKEFILSKEQEKRKEKLEKINNET